METADSWITIALKYVYVICITAYVILIVWAAIKILLENKNPLKTHSYLLMLLLVPVIGLLVYILFGQDYRRNKLFSRKKAVDRDFILSYSEEQLRLSSNQQLVVDEKVRSKEKIINLLLRNNHSFLTSNNKIELLVNGENKFPVLIEDLRQAQHHIHIEYYIFDDDKIGNEIVEILCQKARDGVEVRFVYDDVGTSHIAKTFKKAFAKAGVMSYPFMPVYIPQLSKANFRDHRKIVVIDGKIGYTGGINVADRYINQGTQRYWRDTHMKVSGEAVRSLQVVFMLNWYFVSKQSLSFAPGYFPELDDYGHQCMQIIASGPDSDWASIMQAFFLAIATATDHILITSPYFIPNESILTALKTAAMSGVRVELIYPYVSDSIIVQAASMSYMKEILEAGVNIFLYTKGFIHAKTIIVDGVLSSVGTANMDYRSFDQNFEVNAMIYDTGIARQLTTHFEEDKLQCVPLQLSRWQQRPMRKRLIESTSRLLAPML
jgi:cardiolipin synthase